MEDRHFSQSLCSSTSTFRQPFKVLRHRWPRPTRRSKQVRCPPFGLRNHSKAKSPAGWAKASREHPLLRYPWAMRHDCPLPTSPFISVLVKNVSMKIYVINLKYYHLTPRGYGMPRPVPSAFLPKHTLLRLYNSHKRASLSLSPSQTLAPKLMARLRRFPNDSTCTQPPLTHVHAH